jgi:hypothetical protein
MLIEALTLILPHRRAIAKLLVIASGSCRPSLQTIVNTTEHSMVRVGLCGCVFFILTHSLLFFNWCS